nr:LysR family transcriptional regulator [Pectobacterium parvum]
MGQSDSFDGLAEFLAIAKRLSIRKAALDLGKTPGSVSLSLQKLEHRLGVLLFHRTTRKMALTEAGEDLLLRIGPAAHVIATGFEDVAQSAKKTIGDVEADRRTPGITPCHRTPHPCISSGMAEFEYRYHGE